MTCTPTSVADAIIVLTNSRQVLGPTGNSSRTNIDEDETFDRIKEIIKIKPQSLSHLIVIILKLKSLVSSLWSISLSFIVNILKLKWLVSSLAIVWYLFCISI